MRKIDFYEVFVVTTDAADNSSYHTVQFDDRRKATSYYKSAVAYWSPKDCRLFSDDVKTVDICMVARFADGDFDVRFSEYLEL